MITIYPIENAATQIGDINGLQDALDALAAADVTYNPITGEGNLETEAGTKRIILLD